MNQIVRSGVVFLGLSFVLGGWLLCASAGGADSRNWWPQNGTAVAAPARQADSIPWPTIWALQQTGGINASVTSFGGLGMSLATRTTHYPWWPQVGFESPSGSGMEYLYRGGVWIGGVVGNDTAVTVGDEASDTYSHLYHELLPPQWGTKGLGSIRPCEGPDNLSLRAESVDTLQAGVYYPYSWLVDQHHPLHVKLVDRSHAWHSAGSRKFILHDLVITNIGTQTIHSGYVAMLLDPWIQSPGADLYASGYEMAASLPDKKIIYAVDNDGNPSNGSFVSDSSPTGAIAAKVVASSFPQTNPSYTWWMGYRYYYSYVPQLRQHPGLRSIGYSGNLASDADRYLFMSSGAWQFDQPMIGTISANDPIWLPADSFSAACALEGADVYCLLSTGPFELPPDSSARVIFALFAVDSVQRDPFINDYLPYTPELYLENLNRAAIARAGDRADSLAREISGSNFPVTGTSVAGTASDTVAVAWDPWVFGNSDGYATYVTEIPDSAYPVKGIIPPWYAPLSPEPFEHIGRVNQIKIGSLSPGKGYAFQVANWHDGQAGQLSFPVFLRRDLPSPPQIRDSLLTIRNDGTSLFEFTQDPSPGIDHFNIYKFPDSFAARSRFLPHYNHVREQIEPTETFVVEGGTYYYYAPAIHLRIPGDVRSFEDTTSSGQVYFITAVDSSGFESRFSHPVLVIDGRKSRDVLVMTNSTPSVNFVAFDTIKAFYRSVLYGKTFDFYSFVDSTQGERCPNAGPECINADDLMRYRLVIIDDGLADGIPLQRYDAGGGPFSRYLELGGRIAYFGSFSGMRSNPLDIASPPLMYDAGNYFVKKYFGIDSLFFVGLTYYQDLAFPYVDSQFGFSAAAASRVNFPDLSVDVVHNRFLPTLREYWRPATPPSVSTFKANANGLVTHRYQSSAPATSVNQGQAVAVASGGGDWQTFLFGFHLWYMENAAAKRLIQWMLGDSPTPVDHPTEPSVPSQFALEQNYPNPFNPTTTISFGLPQRTSLTLDIYNILGQRVRRLVDETRAAGQYQVTWDGKDDRGVSMSTGVYIYRLTAGDQVRSRKMLLLK